MLEELERLARRVAALPLAAPLLVLGGLGLGKLTARALALPGEAVVRPAGVVPRIHLDGLSRRMEELRLAGRTTEEYVAVYQHHVAPIERALWRQGVSRALARRVAWPVVEYSYRNGLDPATVASVLVVESRGRPRATSPMGARGLMQVMPAHAGRWRGCGRNLYDIDQNICHGTRILAWYLDRYRGDERRALLGYNGCVRGTNTPDCWRYPDKVRRVRERIRAEMRAARLSHAGG